MVYLIQSTLKFAIPLMIVALAGVFAERSGIINIALEGIMIVGAFVGVLVIKILLEAGFSTSLGQLLLIITILIVALFGALFSMLLAFASVNLKADQTIGGTALNLLAPALVLFLIMVISQQSSLNIPGSPGSLFMLFKTDFGYDQTAELSVIESVLFNKIYPTTYYAILLYIGLSIFLYKTKIGIRIRSCGENPQAADSLGINVYKMRYIGVMISGALAALGGFIFALTAAGCSSTGDVAGLGFLALGVMIFGNWKPLNIAIVSILFGGLKAISAGYASIDINNDNVFFLKELGISSHIYRILPYIVTLLVLAFTSKRTRAPKAEGQPYDKGKR